MPGVHCYIRACFGWFLEKSSIKCCYLTRILLVYYPLYFIGEREKLNTDFLEYGHEKTGAKSSQISTSPTEKRRERGTKTTNPASWSRPGTYNSALNTSLARGPIGSGLSSPRKPSSNCGHGHGYGDYNHYAMQKIQERPGLGHEYGNLKLAREDTYQTKCKLKKTYLLNKILVFYPVFNSILRHFYRYFSSEIQSETHFKHSTILDQWFQQHFKQFKCIIEYVIRRCNHSGIGQGKHYKSPILYVEGP